METEWLSDVPVLCSLSEEALASLGRMLEPIHLHAGAVLYREGDPAGHFYFLISGRLRATHWGKLIGYAGLAETLVHHLGGWPQARLITAAQDLRQQQLSQRLYVAAGVADPRSAFSRAIARDLRRAPDGGLTADFFLHFHQPHARRRGPHARPTSAKFCCGQRR